MQKGLVAANDKRARFHKGLFDSLIYWICIYEDPLRRVYIKAVTVIHSFESDAS